MAAHGRRHKCKYEQMGDRGRSYDDTKKGVMLLMFGLLSIQGVWGMDDGIVIGELKDGYTLVECNIKVIKLGYSLWIIYRHFRHLHAG